eukprot:173023-Prymnesium_polylepis.1
MGRFLEHRAVTVVQAYARRALVKRTLAARGFALRPGIACRTVPVRAGAWRATLERRPPRVEVYDSDTWLQTIRLDLDDSYTVGGAAAAQLRFDALWPTQASVHVARDGSVSVVGLAPPPNATRAWGADGECVLAIGEQAELADGAAVSFDGTGLRFV